MNSQTNRKLHGLAAELAPKPESHDLLKSLAFELFKKQSLGDVTEEEARVMASRLKASKDRMRTQIYRSLNGDTNGGVITSEQLGYARELKRLLGWSNQYFETFLSRRYQEPKLDLMPAWKAVRMISELQKRWHSKKKQQDHQSSQSTITK